MRFGLRPVRIRPWYGPGSNLDLKIEVVVSLGLTVFESDERRALTLRK